MNKLMIALIRLYQKMRLTKTPHCKYFPTCSKYGLECYQKFSFVKATCLCTWRILRCNPWSKGGYDPVPLNEIEKTIKQLTDFFNWPF